MKGFHLSACSFDIARSDLQACFIDIGGEDCGAFLGQRFSGCPSNAASGPGHDSHTSIQ